MVLSGAVSDWAIRVRTKKTRWSSKSANVKTILSHTRKIIACEVMGVVVSMDVEGVTGVVVVAGVVSVSVFVITCSCKVGLVSMGTAGDLETTGVEGFSRIGEASIVGESRFVAGCENSLVAG